MANCENQGGNTGTGKCDIKSQMVDVIIFTDRKASIPKSTPDIQAYLLEKFGAASKRERYYPFNQIQQGTDNSEEAQMGTFSYGASVKQTNGNAMYEWELPFAKCLAEKAISFDGWSGGVFLISKTGNLLCRESADGQSYLPLIPEVPVYVSKAKFIAVNTSDLLTVGFTVNLGDQLAFAKNTKVVPIEGYDKSEIVGLIDLKLVVVNATAGYVNVRVETECGGVNLFDDYKEELSNQILWKAIDTTTGNEVVISGVTANEGTNLFQVAANFSAATYKLSLADTATLADNGVDGYEAKPATFNVA
jgi:hypothetical protein